MATTISTSFGSGLQLTSRLGAVKAATSNAQVAVKVVRDPGGDIDVLYQTQLWAYNGEVELTGLGELIEERFRELGLTTGQIEVQMDEAALTVNALYCEYQLPTAFDPTACFWSASSSSIVHRNSAVQLAHYNDGSNQYQVKVVGLSPEGRTAMVQRTFTRTKTAQWVSFSVAEILAFALNQTEYETGDAISKVAYFAICHGDIQKLFYLAEDPYYLTFKYRNIFNTEEYVDIVGTVKRKTAVERDLAVLGGVSEHYNRKVNRTYEMTTSALTEEQAKEIEQLVASHKTKLCSGSETYDILITDHTCEPDNDDGTLMTAKLTFQLADRRPALREEDLGKLLPSTSHIFTEEFTAEFA